MLAGSILLVPKIWDAVNDTLFGFIIDKVRFRKRTIPSVDPHIIFSYAAVGYFPFQCAEGLRIRHNCSAWIIVGYLLWDTCYTMSDTPIYALSTSTTNNMDERTSILFLSRDCGRNRRIDRVYCRSALVWG